MTISQEMIIAMQGHSAWANARLLDAAEGLTYEQLREPVPGTIGSLIDIFTHMMSAQIGWTRRFQEFEPVKPPEATDFPSITALRSAWKLVDEETAAFLYSLNEEDLQKVVHLKSWFGWEDDAPLWQAILHQAFHQHQHRGEAAMALTALGFSPGELEVFDYLDPDSVEE